jgi:hypothetical protein
MCEPCLIRWREYGRTKRIKLKLDVIEAYGGVCACCGDAHHEFLTIDHIDGRGAAHRLELSKGKKSNYGTVSFYIWLRKNGFPKDNFRLLCFNCNCARSTCGYCPHEVEQVSRVGLTICAGD